jgi:hypothetical protein
MDLIQMVLRLQKPLKRIFVCEELFFGKELFKTSTAKVSIYFLVQLEIHAKITWRINPS